MNVPTPTTTALNAAHPTRELAYMRPDATLTLREGLEEYYGTIDGLITNENASDEVAELFRLHDTTHVLFGCDTSPRGEVLTDAWSLFGTDVDLGTYWRYMQLPETQNIFVSMGWWNVAKVFGAALIGMPKAIWRARAMTRKWSFADHSAFLDLPLYEIRSYFNIRVIEH